MAISIHIDAWTKVIVLLSKTSVFTLGQFFSSNVISPVTQTKLVLCSPQLYYPDVLPTILYIVQSIGAQP